MANWDELGHASFVPSFHPSARVQTFRTWTQHVESATKVFLRGHAAAKSGNEDAV